VNLTVVDLDDSSVTVDANHPLAGRDLVFDIELVEVIAA
jgi:peptidylprolyl isomerase